MAKKSKAQVGKRRRFEIFKRDRFACQYCGRTPPEVLLELDHVIPRSKGGDNSTANLVTSCRDCNRGKADVGLDQIIPAVQQEIADGQERLAQLRAINRLAKAWKREKAKALGDVLDALGWNEFDPAEAGSVRLFLGRLPAHKVVEAAEIAASRKGTSSVNALWKYFCGVCWTKIRRQNERPF